MKFGFAAPPDTEVDGSRRPVSPRPDVSKSSDLPGNSGRSKDILRRDSSASHHITNVDVRNPSGHTFLGSIDCICARVEETRWVKRMDILHRWLFRLYYGQFTDRVSDYHVVHELFVTKSK